MTLKILALGGDGIGPEVVQAALGVLEVAADSIGLDFDLSEDLLHGAAWDALLDRTPFRADTVRGADIVVMRELCGGAMFTRTRGRETLADGGQRAFDLNEYSSHEIERFARVGFEVARRRRGKVVSVALMLEYSAGESDCARKIEAAVDAALNEGLATRDIGGNLGTAAMTDAIIKQFRLL